MISAPSGATVSELLAGPAQALAAAEQRGRADDATTARGMVGRGDPDGVAGAGPGAPPEYVSQ
ncbi:hypothetical protein ACRAWC_20630 [Leifsonia sp. L25]|uniref:hypothetical protein n=1 Tax=Leifsonia sp. L25 TaxID=3423957 RepID=UPI003D698ACC